MLESSDSETVVIATPDHWYAKTVIMAIQAGKHVYLEKSTSHSPAEDGMLVQTALRYNRTVQVNDQRRSFSSVIRVTEETESNSVGKVKYVKS